MKINRGRYYRLDTDERKRLGMNLNNCLYAKSRKKVNFDLGHVRLFQKYEIATNTKKKIGRWYCR